MQTRGCAGRVFSDLEELTGPRWVNILQWSQTCDLPPTLGQESFLCGLDIKQLIEIILPDVLLGQVCTPFIFHPSFMGKGMCFRAGSSGVSMTFRK